jgi:hypothetical protein
MIPEEEIGNTKLLDERMSTNHYAPLMDTDDVMESSIDTSF